MSYLSASITRILSLSHFDSALKTKDIQQAFAEWENERGGFKIKWINDTSLLIVFADPIAAKRAYLQTLLSPPPQFTSPTTGIQAVIRPYDGPDAQTVIAAVNQRAQQGAHRARASMSGPPPANGHGRGDSIAAKSFNANGNGIKHPGPLPHPTSNGITPSVINGSILNVTIAPTAAGNTNPSSSSREGSPTLPPVPSHPTLNALINSTLADMAGPPVPAAANTATSDRSPPPRVNGSPPTPDGGSGGAPTPPRLGNPAKRMLGSALGIRHPALGPRVLSGGNEQLQTIGEVQRALDGLTIAE